MKYIVERDATYTVRDITRMIGSSLSIHYMVKNILNFWKISASWVLHLLTDVQKKQRVKATKHSIHMTKL